jgi:hypothetical protein
MVQQSAGYDVAAAMDRSDRARMRALRANEEQLAIDKSQSPIPEADIGDEDHAQFLPVRTLRTQYIDFQQTKIEEYSEQKQARQMYHGSQWTPEQIALLRRRRQPPMTWNRIARKIAGIVGLVERYRTDPKALPRTPKAEAGAEIATQAIRYVCDRNEFKNTDPWCLMQAAIDGIAGVQLVLTQGDTGDPDIALPWVIGDEYFYDPKSYRADFGDVRYEGIAKWLDVDAAIELFPDKEELLRGLIEGDSDLTTQADREYRWVITATKRVRLVEHWYARRGSWNWAFYISTTLLDQGLSPFYDERGKRCSSFKMFSAAVDHDGDRYGFVRNLKGPQDMLNLGKSRTLHIANSRRLIMEKGAVDDVERARTEWARADGVVERNPGKDIKPDDTRMELTAYQQFTQDAIQEIDQFANANVLSALSGQANVANISGRAVELLRQPGMAELGPFILAYRAWKLQLYKAIWNAVQRHWTAERWLRVTNSQGLAQFIQLNGLGMDNFGRPAIINAVGAVDVDIVLEEGPDIGSLMQETYDALKGYPPGTFPPQVLIEMSALPRSEKDRIIGLLTPKPQQPDPMQEIVKRLQLESAAAQLAQQGANVRKTHAQAEQSLATADEKRASVGLAGADDRQAAQEFSRDTLMQALELDRKMRADAAQQETMRAQMAMRAQPGAAPGAPGGPVAPGPPRPTP